MLQRHGFRHAIFEDNFPARPYALKSALARAERGGDAHARPVGSFVFLYSVRILCVFCAYFVRILTCGFTPARLSISCVS